MVEYTYLEATIDAGPLGTLGECLEPNQLLAERCTAHTYTHIYLYRHVSAHIHTYDAWPTSHAHYTQHTYTHACIHALMHQCIHIKAIVVCICTYIYIHTYRAHNTDMTCIRIYITYIAWIHIVHSMEQGTRNNESKHTANTVRLVLATHSCLRIIRCALEHQTIGNIVLGPPPIHALCSSAPSPSKISGRARNDCS